MMTHQTETQTSQTLPAPKTVDLSVTLSGAGQRALSLLQRQGVSLSHLIEQALIEAACS